MSTSFPQAPSGSAGGGNLFASPRLKYVQDRSKNGPAEPVQGAHGVDIHELLDEITEDNHKHDHGRHNVPGGSPSQRRTASPTSGIRAERDMYAERCNQLLYQVRSLQMAYKESALRRMQEEQAFRELLRSEREKYDRQLGKFASKLESRDQLLLEWVRSISERNALESSPTNAVRGDGGNSVTLNDLRNTLSLLATRSAGYVHAAKQYLTPDDISRANTAQLQNTAKRRGKSGKKRKAKKTSKPNNRNRNNNDEEDEGNEGHESQEEDDGGNQSEDNRNNALHAFRPINLSQDASKKTSAANKAAVLKGKGRRKRKKGGRKSHGGNNSDDEEEEDADDANSTVTGSIMDMDLEDFIAAHDFGTSLDQNPELQDNKKSLHGTSRPSIEQVESDAAEDSAVVDPLFDPMNTHRSRSAHAKKRPGSTNQDDAQQEDADKLLQELVAAVTLDDEELLLTGVRNEGGDEGEEEDVLSPTYRVKSANMAGIEAALRSGSTVSDPRIAVAAAASQEIQDFLELSAQEKETDRILNDLLRQQSNQNHSGIHKSRTEKNDKLVAEDDSNHVMAAENEEMSAAEQAAIEDFLRSLPNSSKQPVGRGKYDTGKGNDGVVLSGVNLEDSQQDMLEQQLQEILQSVSDLTRSVLVDDDDSNSQLFAKASVNNATTSKSTKMAGQGKKSGAPEDHRQLLATMTAAAEVNTKGSIDFSVNDDAHKVSQGTSSKQKKKRINTADRSLIHDTAMQATQQMIQRASANNSIASNGQQSATSASPAAVNKNNSGANVPVTSGSVSSKQGVSQPLHPSATSTKNTAANDAYSSSAVPSKPASANASTARPSRRSSTSPSSRGNGGISAAAAQAVDTYLGTSSGNNSVHVRGAMNSAGSSSSSKQRTSSFVASKPNTATTDAGNVNAAIAGVATQGSVASATSSKYWWDVSIQSSDHADDNGAAVKTTPQSTKRPPSSSFNIYNNSAGLSNSMKHSATGVSNNNSRHNSLLRPAEGDDLQLGGELDQDTVLHQDS